MAIVRFVIAVVINAVDFKIVGIAIGHRPISKWFERLPALTYSNAATAIAFMTIGVATLAHVVPNASKTSCRSTMCVVAQKGLLALETAARLGISSFEIAAHHKGFVSAIASAKPHDILATLKRRAFDNGQTSEPLAC